MDIVGFFSGIKKANEAVENLKSQGINAYADLNDHYQINTSVNTKDLSFLSTSSNADLVINSGTSSGSIDKSPLLAASPMVSGMGKFEEVADINYKVIAKSDSNDKSKVEEIMKSLGGNMQSPNLDIHEHIEDINISKADPDFLE